MRGRYKKWASPFLEAHPEIVFDVVDPKDPFFSYSPLFLEIGIGKGDFILGMQSKLPGHYLGLEKDVSVMGMAAKKVVESGATSIKLCADDFDNVYENIKELRFDVIFLNFSDPWPKARHKKRRLTFGPRLLKIVSLLKEGGEIRFKTDNDDLYAYTLEQIEETKLHIVLRQDEYQFDETLDAMSEYERNFRSVGKSIHRLIIKA